MNYFNGVQRIDFLVYLFIIGLAFLLVGCGGKRAPATQPQRVRPYWCYGAVTSTCPAPVAVAARTK